MDGPSTSLTVFALLLFVFVLTSVRRSHIRVEYSVSWLGAALLLLVFSRSAALMNALTRLVGVSDSRLAVLGAVMAVFLFVFYRFSVVVSGLKEANIALTQRVAILEYYVRSEHESRKA